MQYQILNALVPMPETMVINPAAPEAAEAMLGKWGRVAVKRRVGRGGRNFLVASDLDALRTAAVSPRPLIIQRHIHSRVNGYSLSIRAVAFGGEFVCMYANLARRAHSNHGILAFVSEGELFGLGAREFPIERFNERSWEAKIWFGADDPDYLRHNLYEDEVARTSLRLPPSLLTMIKRRAVKIERFYEDLDFPYLPAACFEETAVTKG